ncbi:MAG: four-carbon acid sugar kinase family protein [Hyphomicrobiales bacterium]|nr:four-carbon acid sugar kinase family protein [Hyphomicrobiales bacterium]
MILGCIGDDFTGSSDIANTLAKGGMRVMQYVGVPETEASTDIDAAVVSLKTRTIPVEDAVRQSLDAGRWLLANGCQQLFFKYCSTFDSTPEGNIGPVTEALAELVGEDHIVMCPAFPTAGRTVYQGHLFVFDALLSESGMKDHPLTPMTDPDLRRFLRLQTRQTVSHLPWQTISKGCNAISAALAQCEPGMVIADAIEDRDLVELGKALASRKLMTGGSGLAIGLPKVHLGAASCTNSPYAPTRTGRGVILSGSCSIATRTQIRRFITDGGIALEVDARDVLSAKTTASDVFNWVQAQSSAPLVFTSAEPAVVSAIQKEFGVEKVAHAVEGFFGALARNLFDSGCRRIVTAGGETSGAVVLALGLDALRIGVEIAPGVPAMHVAGQDIHIALKSGNFGGESFFREALEALGGV